jgi:hypothetical protein
MGFVADETHREDVAQCCCDQVRVLAEEELQPLREILVRVSGSFPFAVESGVGIFEEGIGKAEGGAIWRKDFFGPVENWLGWNTS